MKFLVSIGVFLLFIFAFVLGMDFERAKVEASRLYEETDFSHFVFYETGFGRPQSILVVDTNGDGIANANISILTYSGWMKFKTDSLGRVADADIRELVFLQVNYEEKTVFKTESCVVVGDCFLGAKGFLICIIVK